MQSNGPLQTSYSPNVPRTISIALPNLTLLPLLIPSSTSSSRVSPSNATVLKALVLKLVVVNNLCPFQILCLLVNIPLLFPLRPISASIPRTPLVFIVPIVISPRMIMTTVFPEGVAWMVKGISSLIHLLFVIHRNYSSVLYFLVTVMLYFCSVTFCRGCYPFCLFILFYYCCSLYGRFL